MVYGDMVIWWCMVVVYGGVWWYMVVCCGVWWCLVVYGGVWWYMVVYGGVWWLAGKLKGKAVGGYSVSSEMLLEIERQSCRSGYSDSRVVLFATGSSHRQCHCSSSFQIQLPANMSKQSAKKQSSLLPFFKAKENRNLDSEDDMPACKKAKAAGRRCPVRKSSRSIRIRRMICPRVRRLRQSWHQCSARKSLRSIWIRRMTCPLHIRGRRLV